MDQEFIDELRSHMTPEQLRNAIQHGKEMTKQSQKEAMAHTVRQRIIAQGAMEESFKDIEDMNETVTVEVLYSRAAGLATWQDCQRFLKEKGF